MWTISQKGVMKKKLKHSLTEKWAHMADLQEWKSWLKTQHLKKKKIMASGPITLGKIDGKIGNSDTLFSWVQKSLQMVTAAMKLKLACSFEENNDKPIY